MFLRRQFAEMQLSWVSPYSFPRSRWRHTAKAGGFLNVEQLLAEPTSTGCHVDRPKLTVVALALPDMSGSVHAGDPLLTSGDRTPPHSDSFILPPPPLMTPSLVVFRNKRPSCFCWCCRRRLQSISKTGNKPSITFISYKLIISQPGQLVSCNAICTNQFFRDIRYPQSSHSSCMYRSHITAMWDRKHHS